MKKSIRYIYLAFSASTIIVLFVSLLFFNNLRSLKSYTEAAQQVQKVLNKVQNVQYLLLEAENSQRGFLLTRDSAFVESFERTRRIIYPQVDSLKKLVAGKNKQEKTLIKLRSSIAERYQVLTQTMETGFSRNEALFYQSYVRGKKIMADFNALAAEMERRELIDLLEKNKGRNKYERAAPAYLIIILILSLLFLIVSFILIIKEFRKRYRYQKELEQKINELNMSHAELEQIAFIASHDLQEPLRKIRTFGGMLTQYKNKVDKEGRLMLERIDASATRMQGLIQDIVDYTNLINSQEQLQEVDLNVCISDAQEKLSNLITNHNATITTHSLRKIKGYSFQLQLLFTNLIHNSIKFQREGIAPLVSITAEEILATTRLNPFNHPLENEPYLLIKVRDNGIGFENEFARKIFVIFQRLHHQRSAYEGKGIGLSICKRVMTNHNGFISAEGEPGKGATFLLYFPL